MFAMWERRLRWKQSSTTESCPLNALPPMCHIFLLCRVMFVMVAYSDDCFPASLAQTIAVVCLPIGKSFVGEGCVHIINHRTVSEPRANPVPANCYKWIWLYIAERQHSHTRYIIYIRSRVYVCLLATILAWKSKLMVIFRWCETYNYEVRSIQLWYEKQ